MRPLSNVKPKYSILSDEGMKVMVFFYQQFYMDRFVYIYIHFPFFWPNFEFRNVNL